jgi:outer membrane lipoprotein-sorting protein
VWRLKILLLLAALAVAMPVSGQDVDDATKLFRKMEAMLTGAKTLRISAQVTLTGGAEEIKMKGTLNLAPGGRAHMAMTSTVRGKTRKGTIVSDGDQMQWKVDSVRSPRQPTPPKLNEFLAGKVARAGIGFSFLFAVQDDKNAAPVVKDIDKLYPASAFRLGKREKLSGREVQAVEYQLTWEDKEPVFRATVWLDANTNLPVKRHLTGTKNSFTVTITEVYEDVALGEKLDSKLFTLPK